MTPPFQPTARRSRSLFKAFGVEQTDPDHFYGMMAEDTAAHVGYYEPLDGKLLLDVGGGPGYFADAFRKAGATYLALDADAGELELHGRSPEKGTTVLGSGMQLPFRTGSLDIAFSSNVLEHVPEPWTMSDEMVRVTRPGGLIFISYCNWLSPNGGHESSPWHYLGAERAQNRFERKKGYPPKNIVGKTVFKVSVAAGLEWARSRVADGSVELIEEFPRYHPRWAYPVLRIPGVREVLTWNLTMAMRKR